jgi:aryl-alcohol dehydrogenase-like predicted oxidoreductase
MTHENEITEHLHTGLKRREFMAMLGSCTAALMVPGLSYGEGNPAAATASHSDRLGKLLPLRKLGSSGAVVTNLGVGGDHVGSASEKDAQAIIEKALEEGVRFFDNAPFYSGGKAEERYGKFLTPKYRDVSFIMTKTLAKNRENALKDLDTSLSRMKTDYVDLWQVHALENPKDVEERVQNGVLDAFLDAQKKGKVRHIGFTGHGSYKAHLEMLEELKKRGVKMAASQMPVNPADPHYESFVTHVVPKCRRHSGTGFPGRIAMWSLRPAYSWNILGK